MTKDLPNVVETERLCLRPFVESDISAYAVIRAKPAVVRFLPGGVAGIDEAQATAERIVRHFRSLWEDGGFGPWALVERRNGRLCGHMGLRRLPELQGQTELLYMLDEDVWGRGFATEGARASLAYGFDELGLDRIIALVLPENRPSMAVMERVGMTRNPGLVNVFGLQLVHYAVSRDDWLSARVADIGSGA